MSLWLCLRFEQLPLQCLSHCEQQAVVVMCGQRVLNTNDYAAALGIRTGMNTSTVRALAADEPVQLLERNTSAEQSALQQLCCWAYSITPTLHTDHEHCLQLEIGGCLTLFHGLQSLLEAVEHGIHQRHYQACYGLASTTKAAHLLTFANRGIALAIEQPLQQRLAPLPLTLLTHFDSTVESLQRAGINTLGDLFALPNRALGRRCGKAFVHYLEQLQGHAEDIPPNYEPPAYFDDHYWFGYDVKTNEELLPAIEKLLQSLCLFLRNTQLRTSEIHWQLIGIDGKLRNICVRSSNTHSHWENWYELTNIRFAQLQLEGSIEGLSLRCEHLRPGQQENIDLFSPRHQREPLESLLDRLRSRLGLQAIEKISCRNEHLPEFAVHVSNDDHQSTLSTTDMPPCKQRPFWLMPAPKSLRNHRGILYWKGALTLVYGPERIEDNWWEEPVSRDYFIARNPDGQHYWVFNDRLANTWYVHGVFQ